MKFFIFIFTLFVSTYSFAQADCSNQQTQTDMNICSYKKYQKVNNELNSVYKKAMIELKNSNKALLLKENQRVWLKYRDLTCKFEAGPREESGTIWPLIHNNCMVRLTQYRVKEIPNGFTEGLD